MISNKYSLNNFEVLPEGSTARKEYLNGLQSEIARQLDSIIHSAVSDVANRLIELGHNLKESEHSYDSEYASWSYEFSNTQNTDHPRVWLTTQVGVVSGYLSES